MKAKPLLFLGVILAGAQLASCHWRSFDARTADSYFPLRNGMSWTYRLVDRNRGTSEILTDRVIGEKHAGAAQAIGEVESQFSGPTGKFASVTIYIPEKGYLSRQSNYIPERSYLSPRSDAGERTQALFAERWFLPQLLKPDLSWSNVLAPFDHEPDAFQVSQQHRTYFESNEVEVPAGRFSGCIRIETDALYRSDSQDHGMRLRYLDWYAPQVGLVKTVVLKSGWFGSEVAHVELLSFHNAEPHAAPRLISLTSGPVIE